MNIAGEIKQVLCVLDKLPFEAPLEEMADPLMARVILDSVVLTYGLHEAGHPERFFLPEDEVEVIRHQGVGMNGYTSGIMMPLDEIKKGGVFLLNIEEGSAVDATVVDVKESVCRFGVEI